MRLPTLGTLLLLGWTALSAGEAPVPELRLEGKAELFRPGHVSTAATEVRITFSPDGKRMLWGVIRGKADPAGWDIVESILTPDGWSAPAPVSFDTPANEFDPAFAPDGSGVYFFSNRPGGFGGDDIYFAPLDPVSGRYGAAVNLGPSVNSPGDEWAPCPSPDGQRLLFASDGRGGQGRHDLFIAARGPDGKWQPAQPVVELNSAEDDFDATFLPDGRSVVFSRGNLEGRVALFFTPWTGTAYGACSPLGEAVNAPGEAFMNGPSVAAGERDWLYFSTYRPDGAGRMDIYRIRYRLAQPVTSAATAGAARR